MKGNRQVVWTLIIEGIVVAPLAYAVGVCVHEFTHGVQDVAQGVPWRDISFGVGPAVCDAGHVACEITIGSSTSDDLYAGSFWYGEGWPSFLGHASTGAIALGWLISQFRGIGGVAALRHGNGIQEIRMEA